MTTFCNRCPCCSGKEYAVCCKPFHEGQLPHNALELMRSRYSAYALNLPDYIIQTTHPKSPHYEADAKAWKESITQFSHDYLFQKLEIADFKELGSSATVTFTAHLFKGDQEGTFTEKSYFEKTSGRWLYRRGEFLQNLI